MVVYHLRLFKKIPRFALQKAMRMSLNGSCVMVFKQFAGQLMYVLRPLPEPLQVVSYFTLKGRALIIELLHTILKAVWNHFTSKIHSLVKCSRKRSILGILDVAIYVVIEKKDLALKIID